MYGLPFATFRFEPYSPFLFQATVFRRRASNFSPPRCQRKVSVPSTTATAPAAEETPTASPPLPPQSRISSGGSARVRPGWNRSSGCLSTREDSSSRPSSRWPRPATPARRARVRTPPAPSARETRRRRRSRGTRPGNRARRAEKRRRQEI